MTKNHPLGNAKTQKMIGVLNPKQKACKALENRATFYKHIRVSALQSSQFPPVITDEKGQFHKPNSW